MAHAELRIPDPTPPEVVLTLTHEEARVLRDILSGVYPGGTVTRMIGALNSVGYEYRSGAIRGTLRVESREALS